MADTTSATDVLWALHSQACDSESPQRLQIATSPFTVGRHADNTASLANSTVSGRHAEILMAGEEILIRDLGSTNGTLLNGRHLQTVEVLRCGDIVHFGNVMFTIRKEEQSQSTATVASDAAGDAIAQVQFNTLMNRPGVQPYFQPIVNLHDQRRVGFEVLTRSKFIGLETPDKMFRVAAQRTSEAALSRVCRSEGVRASTQLATGMKIYLNTHPAELNTPELFESLHTLRTSQPDLDIVLEVHESGVASVDFLKQLRNTLDELSMGLAYDDFGAGQARLDELIEVPPDVLKFDVKLVQGLPTATDARRSTIESLIRIVTDLDVIPLAEGIETADEAAICKELGFELAQGYLFGKGEPVGNWLN